MPERDATVDPIAPPREQAQETSVLSQASTPRPQAQTSVQEPKEDLGAVEWFYRDPAGQEQGAL